MKVRIDGQDVIFVQDKTNVRQWNELDQHGSPVCGHTFPNKFSFAKGDIFNTNGHRYEILSD